MEAENNNAVSTSATEVIREETTDGTTTEQETSVPVSAQKLQDPFLSATETQSELQVDNLQNAEDPAIDQNNQQQQEEEEKNTEATTQATTATTGTTRHVPSTTTREPVQIQQATKPSPQAVPPNTPSASTTSYEHDDAHHPLNVYPPLSVYYSDDPIDNLRIRVVICPQPSSITSHQPPKTIKALNLKLKQQKKNEEEEQQLRQEAIKKETLAKTLDAEMRGLTIPVDEQSIQHTQQEDGGVAGAGNDSLIEQTLDWQEKQHSISEILIHCHPNYDHPSLLLLPHLSSLSHINPHSPIQKQYHHNIISLMNSLYPNLSADAASRQYILTHSPLRLSTQTVSDAYVDPREYQRRVYEAERQLNPLARKTLDYEQRYRDKRSHLSRDYHVQSYHILVNPSLPTKESQLHTVSQAQELMQQEIVLCQLKYYEESGCLEMRPGFSITKKDPQIFVDEEWYSFYAQNGQHYRYRIENAAETENRSNTNLSEIVPAVLPPHRHPPAPMVSLSSMTKQHLSSLPPNHRLFYYQIQILFTSHFRPNQLYIEWELHLPEQWKPYLDSKHKSVLNGSTQISQAEYQLVEKNKFPSQSSEAWTSEATDDDEPRDYCEEVKVCCFCLPIDCELLLNEAYMSQTLPDLVTDFKEPDSTTIAAAPIMYPPPFSPLLIIQVNSVSRWFHCHRVEGYTYFSLPTAVSPSKGHRTLFADCWKPIGTITDQLTEYFIGGSVQLRDRKTVAVPSWEEQKLNEQLQEEQEMKEAEEVKENDNEKAKNTRKKNVLNRFGLHTETTGRVYIQVEVISSKTTTENETYDEEMGESRDLSERTLLSGNRAVSNSGRVGKVQSDTVTPRV